VHSSHSFFLARQDHTIRRHHGIRNGYVVVHSPPSAWERSRGKFCDAPLRAQTGRLIMPDSGGSPRPGRKSPRGGEDVPTVRSLREDRSSRHGHCLLSPRKVSILHVLWREPVKQMLGISKLLAQWWLTSFPT